MEREKLNKGIMQFRESVLRSEVNFDFDKTWGENLRPYEQSFEEGVKWLISQPLSERLTEEEREKMITLHYDFERLEIYGASLHDRAAGRNQCAILESIFGKEMFENIK